MERSPVSTPKQQLETELSLAQSQTTEFVHGLDRGIREAHIIDFEAQGAPHIYFPDVQRKMIKSARAWGKGLYDREGARAYYYGVRAGIDSVVNKDSDGED